MNNPESDNKQPACCMDCKQPFKYGVNIFTPAGRRESTISGVCEKCFESYFEEDEE